MLAHRTSRATSGWRLVSVPLALAALLALAAPAAAANPPGNNGTIKIDALAFDDHPDNEPHVGCNFQVDFYGFDEDESYFADVIFELHPPTAADQTMSVSTGNLHPFIGDDDNGGGGSEAGLDASQAYTLSFTGAPHPHQGYHVKLTIHAPGSQGADVKHKVFWVTDCGGQLPGNPSSPPGGGGGGVGVQPPVRAGTQAGAGAPVTRVPDTALDSAADVGASALMAAVVLIGGCGVYAASLSRSRRTGRR